MSGLCARRLFRNGGCALLAAFLIVQHPDGGESVFNDLTGASVELPVQPTPPQPPLQGGASSFPQQLLGKHAFVPQAEGTTTTAGPSLPTQQPATAGYASAFTQFFGSATPAPAVPPTQPQAPAVPAGLPGFLPPLSLDFYGSPTASAVGAVATAGNAAGSAGGAAGLAGGNWSPFGSRAQNALAAGLPVHTAEVGDVTGAAPVTDTSVPVGFLSSANGVYKVPRFPSGVQSVSEPNEDAIKKCILRISASQMTSGFSDTLKSGGVQITGSAFSQLLRLVGTSSPRYTSKLSAPIVLFQRAVGTRISYEIRVAVPQGCVLLPSDPNLMGLIRREGKYIVEAAVRLQPDMLAEYSSSVAAVPADVVAFAAALAPNSNFQPLGHCVYVAHFTTKPENIQLFASYTQVKVVGVTAMGMETLQLQIPLACLPQSLHRTALWSVGLHSGTAVIVAFSPPPKAEPEWFVVRTTGDEAAFSRLTGSRP
ncbi:hypothetical protein, conserved [Eimeria tenella]|uniref:Transmembrane protein n=1 Tax=Eimeria tenella TaxID=5802 RepID=U6L0A4_EIMTE|nr:hypothetical protein, conserved [Eimeria tenella]CDJ41999.1 hypothetical protein, conserved [Eimeria tenella]|eukprot:XP_013232749.1 hypothetical protein, conserved [Eimeria tenella]